MQDILTSPLPSKEALHGLDLPVSNLEQVQASWFREPESALVPIGTDDLNTLGRLSDDQVDNLERQLRAALGDTGPGVAPAEALGLALHDVAGRVIPGTEITAEQAAAAGRARLLRPRGGEEGFTQAALLPRLAMGLTGAALEGAALRDDLSDAHRNIFRIVGGFLMVGAATPLLKQWASGWMKGLTKQMNPLWAMTAPQKEVFTRYVESLTYGRTAAVSLQRDLEKVFPDEQSRRLVTYVIEEMDPATCRTKIHDEATEATRPLRGFFREAKAPCVLGCSEWP